MQQKYKNIIFTTLLILSFVISLHSIIPHDHHNNQSEETHNKQCEDNQKEPIHCHLFNDLVIIKKSIPFHNSIKQIIILINIISYIDIEHYGTSISQKLFQKSIHIPDEILLSDNTPKRGSPLFYK